MSSTNNSVSSSASTSSTSTESTISERDEPTTNEKSPRTSIKIKHNLVKVRKQEALIPLTTTSLDTTSTAAADSSKKDNKKKGSNKKNETNLTSGCGYGRAKKRLLSAFWSTLWPKLEKDCNWRKVRLYTNTLFYR